MEGLSDVLNFLLSKSNTIQVLTVTITLAILSKTILNYLNDTKQTLEKSKELRGKIDVLKQKKGLEEVIKSAISNEDKQKELLDLFENEINSKITELEKVIEVKNELINNPEKHREKQLIENFEKIRTRLTNEIESLSRRANLNLTIGISSSTLAIGFLFYSGWYLQIEYNEKWFNFITFFIPKFSLLVFLGTFSFYFLNLYKSNLNVIQNYQNELNNVDFKIISIISLLLSSHKEKEIHLKELITNISNVEWNRVLKKDETTVELQKLQETNSFDKDMAFKLWTLNQIFNDAKPNDTKSKK